MTCNCTRYVLSAIAGFVFIFLYEWVLHGMLLMPIYEATADVWRPEAEMQSLMHWAFISQVAFAFVAAWIFTRNYEGKGIGEGVRFGFYLGLLLAVLQIGMYPYMPVPMMLVIYWALGALVEGIGLGIVFAFTYRGKGARLVENEHAV